MLVARRAAASLQRHQQHSQSWLEAFVNTAIHREKTTSSLGSQRQESNRETVAATATEATTSSARKGKQHEREIPKQKVVLPSLKTKPHRVEPAKVGVPSSSKAPMNVRYEGQTEGPQASSSKVKLSPESSLEAGRSVQGQTSGVDSARRRLDHPNAQRRVDHLWAQFERLKNQQNGNWTNFRDYRSALNIARGMLTCVRNIRARRNLLLDRNIRPSLREIRQKTSEYVLALLDNLLQGRTSHLDQDYMFVEQLLRIEATAYSKGTDEACDLLDKAVREHSSTFSDLFVRRVKRRSVQVSVRRRQFESIFDVVEGILEASHHPLLSKLKRRRFRLDALYRILKHRLITQLYLLADVERRVTLYDYLSIIRAPSIFVRKLSDATEGDISGRAYATRLAILALVRAGRSVEAHHVYAWADRNDLDIPEHIAAHLMRSLLESSQDDLADDVLRILKQRIEAAGKPALGRITYQLISWRYAKAGLAKPTFDALQAMQKHYNESEKLRSLNEKFTYSMKLLLASSTGDVQECLTLLGQKYRLHELLDRSDTRLLPKSDADAQPIGGPQLRFIVEAYLNADLIHEAEQIVQNAVAQDFSIPDAVFDSLLCKYAKRNDVASATLLFGEMRRSDKRLSARPLNAMIRMFAENKDVQNATDLLEYARSEGVRVTRQMYTSLLYAHYRARSWPGALTLFRQMCLFSDRRLRPGVEAFNIMLQIHVYRPLPVQKTFDFVREMAKAAFKPDERTYSTMLVAATDANLTDLAEDIFTLIERQLGGQHGRPSGKGANNVHFTIMIQHYLSREKFDIAKEYLQELIRRQMPVDGVLRGIIVKAYAHAQGEQSSVDVAQSLANSYVAESPKDFLEIYRPLISRAARASEVEIVESLIRDATSRSIEVPVQVWTELLDSLRRRGNSEGAMQVWRLIFDKVLVQEQQLASFSRHDPKMSLSNEPSSVSRSRRHVLCVPLSMIIDSLTFAARYNDVARIWMDCRQAGFGFDSHNWNHLAVAMMQSGRILEACDIIERVLNADPPPSINTEAFRTAAEERMQRRTRPQKQNRATLPGFVGQADVLFGEEAGDRAQEHERSRNTRHKQRTSPVYPPNDADTEIPHEVENVAASDVSIDGFGEVNVARLLKPLHARQLLEPLLSPWFAHFDTLRTLYEIIQAFRKRDGRIMLRRTADVPESKGREANDDEDVRFSTMSSQESAGKVENHRSDYITVSELMQSHPRVNELLGTFEQSLEETRERQEKFGDSAQHASSLPAAEQVTDDNERIERLRHLSKAFILGQNEIDADLATANDAEREDEDEEQD